MFSYFFDPVLRAPTLGCMLMGLSSALIGTLVFLQKRSLLGEALSHAAYPGVVIGMGICALAGFGNAGDSGLFFSMGGALACSLIGLYVLEWLEKKRRICSDAALCFLLASFFGIGVLIFSALQSIYPAYARQVQTYLYGQAATMTDAHVAIYAVLAVCIGLFIWFAYRPLQAMLFDPEFSMTAKAFPRWMPQAVCFLLLLSIVVGIRSAGVILMSGMSIAPAAAARQFTNRLGTMFALAAAFGIASGFLGNWISVEASIGLSDEASGVRCSLPTGPMIVLIGSFIAIASLLFAPKRGVAARLFKILGFKLRCIEENVLKELWKKQTVCLRGLRDSHRLPLWLFYPLLYRMQRNGWMIRSQGAYALSSDGMRRAARIVRLHRLWEVYLADLGWPEAQVHRTAEEMEHILTPELEARLAVYLFDPKVDPHSQPIPQREDL